MNCSTLSFVGCPALYSRHIRCRKGRCYSQPFSDGDFDKGRDSAANRLEGIVKRKKEKIQAYLDEIGMEELENRMQDALKIGAGPTPFAFSQKVAEVGMVEGRPLLIFEVGRSVNNEGESVESAEEVAERAARLVKAGADALSVRVDEGVTPEGDKDAFMVRQACRSVPVFYRDWLLHPLQLVNAKSAGCTGVLGIVASVTGPKGTPVMSSFGSALGLDSPVEVVNLAEMKTMAEASVPFYCMDIGVSLSVGIAGFGSDVVQGVLGEMPFGSLSIVGLRDIEKARSVRAAGADGLYIRKEIVDMYAGNETTLVSHIKSLVDGD